ncbi:MAG TPA: alpha/beta hydrolase [Phycisphaerae bacterium]|nr:alpha/beta hydrolase [Phycisphaerae bacterium]
MARGDRFFHFPTHKLYDRPEEHGLVYESVFFDSRDGVRLHAWFFPAVGDVREPSLTRPTDPGSATVRRRAKGTVVHCHGNAGNITGHYRFVAWLPKRGWNVLCFDYRGYGESQGRATRQGTLLDTHAAIDYVRTRDEVDPSRIVLFGQSLGGVVGIVAAAQRDDLAALAVEGAFAGYQQEALFVCRNTWWLWGAAGLVSRWFVASGCDAIDYIDRIGSIPKLFMCGTEDGIVDYRQTLALHQRACDPKELWVLDGNGHTEALIDDEPDQQYPQMTRRDRFCRFLQDSVDGSDR